VAREKNIVRKILPFQLVGFFIHFTAGMGMGWRVPHGLRIEQRGIKLHLIWD
jgi:hypothetical protein